MRGNTFAAWEVRCTWIGGLFECNGFFIFGVTVPLAQKKGREEWWLNGGGGRARWRAFGISRSTNDNTIPLLFLLSVCRLSLRFHPFFLLSLCSAWFLAFPFVFHVLSRGPTVRLRSASLSVVRAVCAVSRAVCCAVFLCAVPSPCDMLCAV